MIKIKRSHKKLDPDIKAVFALFRALRLSSSPAMLESNLRYIANYFGYEVIKKEGYGKN